MGRKGFSLPQVIILIIVSLASALAIIFIKANPTTTQNTIREIPDIDIPQVASPSPQSQIAKDVDLQIQSSQIEGWNTYTSEEGRFSIDYPPNWRSREYPSSFVHGAGFQPNDKPVAVHNEFINISVADRTANVADRSFEEYVKIAAPYEIQNYESLNSIKKVTTISNVDGFEVIWNYTDLEGNERISHPFIYFPAANNDNSKTIQLTLSSNDYLDTFQAMLKTFRYSKQ